jgi:NAD-dependent DNA ligase
MIKNFFPTICQECNQPLSIEFGKGGGYKLMCINDDCSGTDFKKFEKGIISLSITNLGPATIKLLYDAGIDTVDKFFDKTICNKQNLINSTLFKDGRMLDKIIESINNIKELKIEKLIESIQFDNIGTSFSIEIGKYLSEVDYNFSGYNLDIREKLLTNDSYIINRINEIIKLVQKNGINVIKFEKPKDIIVKKVNMKNVDCCGNLFDIDYNSIDEFIKKLNFNKCNIYIDKCDILLVETKDTNDEKQQYAEKNNIKIMTFKQAKFLFL